MEEDRNQQNQLLWGLLIGAILGAVAGVMLATKSGKELRAEIREKGSKAIDEAKGFYDDTSSKVKDILHEAKIEADEIKTDINRHLSEGRQKAKEILSQERIAH